jgi:hypothetical protein
MQNVVRDVLPKDISDLLCPILEMNRNLLGSQVKKI